MLNCEQVRVLLDEIDRLRSDSNHHKQAAVDISDENDKLRKENISLNQSAKSLVDVNHQLQKELFEQNQLMNELFLKAERLEKLVQPDPERGPGFVGGESWSPFAENLRLERDELMIEVQNLRAWARTSTETAVGERNAAREGMKQLLTEKIELRDELNSLCEEIRCLKEENDELSDEVKQLGDMISAMKMKTKTKSELSHVHYSHDEFIGIDGYGPFSLKKLCKDRWEIKLGHEKVTLFNRKGRQVRGEVADTSKDWDGDW